MDASTKPLLETELHRQVLQIDYRTTRNAWILASVDGRRALHVGCTDRPTRDLDTNLHYQIYHSGVAKVWHGVDIDMPGLEWLSKHCAGLYHITSEVPAMMSYDVLIVPEVIEHIEDAGEFLRDLRRYQFEDLLVTSPNASSVRFKVSADHMASFEYVEHVHREHVSWYSPYTLYNLLKRSGYDPYQIVLLNNDSMVGIKSKRR